MYDRVLIHVDRKRGFETYLPFLRSVLRKELAREAVLTTAVKPSEPTLFGYVLDAADVAAADAHNLTEADGFLNRIAASLQAEGARVQTKVLVGDPAEAFREYAAAGGFDLVVVAPTGRRYLLTGKSKAFRRALRAVARPVMILQALPQPAHAA
jgi:nucleotide-binding universal stress UspA family protein